MFFFRDKRSLAVDSKAITEGWQLYIMPTTQREQAVYELIVSLAIKQGPIISSAESLAIFSFQLDLIKKHIYFNSF